MERDKIKGMQDTKLSEDVVNPKPLDPFNSRFDHMMEEAEREIEMWREIIKKK